MRFELCSRGLGINLHDKHIHIVEVRISLQLEARLTRFLQDEIESIAQMRYEDLPGSDSVVFLDVPAVSLTILLPNLPPCPTLYASSPQYSASPPLASSYTLPCQLFVSIHHMFVPPLVPVCGVLLILLLVLPAPAVRISTLRHRLPLFQEPQGRLCTASPVVCARS